MPRSATRVDLLACSGGRARTSTSAVPRARDHAAGRLRRLHLDAGTEGAPTDLRTRDRAVVAARGARGPGDRGPQLRARDHRVGGHRGRAAQDADLRDDLVPGVPRDPGALRPERPALVRRRAAYLGRGAPVRGPPRRHRLLLHLERPDVRERRGVRQRAPALPASRGRTRRRRVARVPLERPSAVRRSGLLPARGRRVAAQPNDLERGPGGLDRHGSGRERVAIDGPDHVPRRRQRLGTMPEARSLPAVPAPGDAPVGVDDALLERGRRGRRRTRLGARCRDGAVGCVRQGAPWALGLGHPRLLLRGAAAADPSRTRPDPRPGRERPHLDPRRAVPTPRHAGRGGARLPSRDDHRRRPAHRDHPVVTRRALLVAAVAVAVAVAFADSSIVVLALPELYARFDTTIEGVAWVITSYNLVLAICALALVLVVHHARANLLLAAGTLLFLAASIACALADSIGLLIAARSVQGFGG